MRLLIVYILLVSVSTWKVITEFTGGCIKGTIPEQNERFTSTPTIIRRNPLLETYLAHAMCPVPKCFKVLRGGSHT